MGWLLIFVYLSAPGVTVTNAVSVESANECAATSSSWIAEAVEAGGQVISFECKKRAGA